MNNPIKEFDFKSNLKERILRKSSNELNFDSPLKSDFQENSFDCSNSKLKEGKITNFDLYKQEFDYNEPVLCDFNERIKEEFYFIAFARSPIKLSGFDSKTPSKNKKNSSIKLFNSDAKQKDHLKKYLVKRFGGEKVFEIIEILEKNKEKNFEKIENLIINMVGEENLDCLLFFQYLMK